MVTWGFPSSPVLHIAGVSLTVSGYWLLTASNQGVTKLGGIYNISHITMQCRMQFTGSLIMTGSVSFIIALIWYRYRILDNLISQLSQFFRCYSYSWLEPDREPVLQCRCWIEMYNCTSRSRYWPGWWWECPGAGCWLVTGGQIRLSAQRSLQLPPTTTGEHISHCMS